MEADKKVEEINSFGFTIVRKAFTKIEINKILSIIETKDNKASIPFSKIPWGYGNLISDCDFKIVYENNHINSLCSSFLNEDFEFNHLLINNKAPFIGPSVEWHREIFNVNTFGPGAVKTDDCWKNFLQVYIALDPHLEENGCLKIIPKSHLIDKIQHEDIVNDRFGHKRRVPSEIMHKILKNHKMQSVYMDPGDILFFNHKLLHGSSSNVSDKNRKSIVMQARLPFERDENIFEKEASYRDSFIISVLEDKIKHRKSKNVYRDFVKGGKDKNK